MMVNSVVNFLNEHGYKKIVRNEQRAFTFDMVRTILDNSVYCGKIFYNRRTNCKAGNQKKKDVIVVDGAVFEIVSGLTMLPVFRERVLHHLGNTDVMDRLETELKKLGKTIWSEEMKKRKLGEDWGKTWITWIFWMMIMIMPVYGRFFKLYLYTAVAPVPLSSFAGESSQSVGKSLIKSYSAVCLEGAIIVLACIIFLVFAASSPAVNPDAAAVTMVWGYIGELVFNMVFNMLVLVGAVKMADRVVREMMGL